MPATGAYYPNIYLYRRLVNAKLYIDKNFSTAIDLNNIADEACFSKFHFIRLFKKIYGHTPHQYLIAIRISNAKKQLIEGLTVAEACYTVGFESVSSFTGLFKKLTGTTPAAYQAAEHKKKAMTLAHPLHFIPGCFARTPRQPKKSNYQETEI